MIHVCHAHACERRVPPEMLMCWDHWFKVPIRARRFVTGAYQIGQETSKRPTAFYMSAAHMAIAHVAQREGYGKAAEYHRQQAEKFASWAGPVPAGEEVSGA